MAADKQRTVVPRLRFPEFVDAGGWSQGQLGAMATFLKGKGIAKADVVADGAIPCIRYGELYTIYGEVIDAVQSRTNVAAEDLLLSEPSDVVVPASGETKFDIAKASCVRAGGVALGSDLNVLRTEHNGVFLSYLLNGSLRGAIARVAQGDAVVHLYPSQLKALAVATPCRSEQQKIADCLTSLDEVIAAQGRKVEALKTHKRGLMQQLFPREGETVPRLRFPEFRGGPEWDEAPLGEVFDTRTGGTPDRGKPEYWNGEIPWITTSLVDFNVIVAADQFISDAGLVNSSATVFPAGTVLVAMYGQGKTRGKTALLGVEAATNQACAAILPVDRVDPRFTFAQLSGRYEGLRALSNAGGQENLSQGLVRELRFHYPAEPEQQRIADCLTALDDQVTAANAKLDALKTHKKGLMQQLFPALEVSA